MLNVFRYYKITPIFVFDGTTPAEKKALLIKRKENKQLAEKEYHSLKENMNSLEHTENEKRDIQQQLANLKKQFVYIRREQIVEVKKLFDAYGAEYIEHEGESDELCASLVSKGDAWACLSEDMDQFVYGTTRILRYLSIINHNVVLYDVPEILKQLAITQEELKKICVLSGTDYDLETEPEIETIPRDLKQTVKFFRQWKKDGSDVSPDFYTWLIKNTDYVKKEEMGHLTKVEAQFELRSNIDDFGEMFHLSGKKIEKKWMDTILKNAGFLI